MWKKSCHIHFAPLMIFLVIFLISCQSDSSENETVYLIRVRESIVTVSDFKNAFDELGGSVPLTDEALRTKMKLRLANQFIDELIIKERAKDINIDISGEELNRAIENIRSDYPDDTFDQIMLENAISYAKWTEGVKNRLLIEKVISKELKDQVEITSSDIVAFYEGRYQRDPGIGNETDINQEIISQLQREKSETNYHRWMKSLKDKYQVEINTVQWKRLLGEQ